jgi:hypothetical protein
MIKNKLNILLLDDNNDRLLKTSSSIKFCDDGRYCVDAQTSIDQKTYESNNYDIVLAHSSNKEVYESIEDNDWDSGDAVMIFFSGAFTIEKIIEDGEWFVSASFLQKRENICILLKEAYEQWL